MQAHKAIEGLAALRRRGRLDSEIFDLIEKKVVESQKFEFDFGEFPVLTEDEMQRQMQDAKMPYELCFFSIPNIGSLMTREHEDCILLQPFFIMNGQVGMSPPDMPLLLDKRDGSVCCKSEDPKVQAEWQDPNDKGVMMILSLISLVVRGVSVLNCSNVVCVDNPPPAALNKKRAKSGKPPLYSYKTLHIKTSVAKERSEHDKSDSNRNEPRLHMRRGHIRRLHSGSTTWVQSCMVGSAMGGMVIKDYRVT